MRSMSLARYTIEVRGVADELLEYLKGPLGPIAAQILERNPAAITKMLGEERYDAIAFLAKTPSQRDRAIKHDDEKTALLILRARYVGLQAASALAFAENFETVVGRSYRGAAAMAARVTPPRHFEPTTTELFAKAQ
jgi:hypothetical protein